MSKPAFQCKFLNANGHADRICACYIGPFTDFESTVESVSENILAAALCITTFGNWAVVEGFKFWRNHVGYLGRIGADDGTLNSTFHLRTWRRERALRRFWLSCGESIKGRLAFSQKWRINGGLTAAITSRIKALRGYWRACRSQNPPRGTEEIQCGDLVLRSGSCQEQP